MVAAGLAGAAETAAGTCAGVVKRHSGKFLDLAATVASTTQRDEQTCMFGSEKMPWRLVLVLLLCKMENALCFAPSWPCLRAHGKSHACCTAWSTLKRAQPAFATLVCKKDNNGKKVAANLKTSKGFAASASPVKRQHTLLPKVTANLTDDLNLHQLAKILTDVRTHYNKTSSVPQVSRTLRMACALLHNEITEACILILQEVVRRNLHLQRISDLRISRSKIALSTINGAGQGLFATRNIEAGELITCYPGDAGLCWEDSDHSRARDIQVFHGSHVSRYMCCDSQ